MKHNSEQIKNHRKQQAEEKYRQSQKNKGVVRYQFQATQQSKEKFEQMATAIAAETAQPYDLRQRLAQARTQLFDDITQHTVHEFTVLTDKIATLTAEVQALSPVFNPHSTTERPLPQTIADLPNDPKQLKVLLANLYQETQQAKQQVAKYQQQAQQYQDLYNTSENYNEQLKAQIEQVASKN